MKLTTGIEGRRHMREDCKTQLFDRGDYDGTLSCSLPFLFQI